MNGGCGVLSSNTHEEVEVERYTSKIVKAANDAGLKRSTHIFRGARGRRESF